MCERESCTQADKLPTLPTMHHGQGVTSLDHFITLNAAFSGATKYFKLLFPHMQLYSPRSVNTLYCVKLVELPFKTELWSPSLALVMLPPPPAPPNIKVCSYT